VLLGLQIERLAAPGEYGAGFALRMHPRSLVCFTGDSADRLQMAVPTASARLVLVVYRRMLPSLARDMAARGNAM
jgi:hypothetical protein